jgi:hypothetical protein
MRTERDFDRTVDAGRRNQEVKELVQNWCAHARVQKFGGTGLIEIQTGFPIGPHSMTCDQAPAGGMATWLLEESALSFHDQHCVGCKKRKPVQLPNLSKLVAQRDNDAACARAREAQSAEEARIAFEERQRKRISLRGQSSAALNALIDDLDQYDRDRSSSVQTQIVETAKLAPELFAGEISEYIFRLLEADEHWFEEVGLFALRAACSDPGRLTRCALRSLTTGPGLEVAAEIVQENIALVEPANVAAAVRGLAVLATPLSDPFPYSSRTTLPEPLVAVYENFRKEVESGLEVLLRSERPFYIQTAAKAIVILCKGQRGAAASFIKTLLAKLTRIDRALDSDRDSEVDSTAHDLESALVSAFFAAPVEVDTEILKFFEGASSQGEARLASVYSRVLREGIRIHDDEPIADLEPYRVALRRLLSLSGTSKNHEVLQEVTEALRALSQCLIPLAQQERDLLIGGAAVLDSRIEEFDAAAKLEPGGDWLSVMDRQNRRSQLYYLREAAIRWAAGGAAESDEDTRDFISIAQRGDALTDSLRACLIEELPPLMQTAASTNESLPLLYGALVSRSTRERAAAAKVIRDLGNRRLEELPKLVIEAFLLLLGDPYKIVHQSAVHALERVSLPKEYEPQVLLGLWHLIHAYKDEKKDESFLLQCIEVFTRMRHGDPEFAGQPGRVFVALLEKMDSANLARSSHRWTLERLANCEGFDKFVRGLVRGALSGKGDKEMPLHLLRSVPPASLSAMAGELLTIAAEYPADLAVSGSFLEVLTARGDWHVAEQVAQTHAEAIPDNIRNRTIRLHAKQRLLASRLERLVAEGNLVEARQTGRSWHEAARQLEEIRKDDESKDPFRSRFLGTHSSS